MGCGSSKDTAQVVESHKDASMQQAVIDDTITVIVTDTGSGYHENSTGDKDGESSNSNKQDGDEDTLAQGVKDHQKKSKGSKGKLKLLKHQHGYKVLRGCCGDRDAVCKASRFPAYHIYCTRGMGTGRTGGPKRSKSMSSLEGRPVHVVKSAYLSEPGNIDVVFHHPGNWSQDRERRRHLQRGVSLEHLAQENESDDTPHKDLPAGRRRRSVSEYQRKMAELRVRYNLNPRETRKSRGSTRVLCPGRTVEIQGETRVT